MSPPVPSPITPPRLSICIPTYNRGAYIGQTIQSILDRTDATVEIVVSDNASADETRQVVERLRAQRPIVYHRFDENVGADRNFLQAVSLASGDYCWLFGSDDQLISPVDPLLDVFDVHPGISGLSFPALTCNFSLTESLATIGGSFPHHDVVTRFETAEETFLSVGEYFGFLTGHIFRRSAWLEAIAQFDPSPFFNAYVHVYIFGRMMRSSPAWAYRDEVAIAYRAGNDSFLVEGEIRRMELDIEGYHEIAVALFGEESDTTRRFHRKICRMHIRPRVWTMHQNLSLREFWGIVPRVFRAYGRTPEFYTHLLPFILIPVPMIKGVRALARFLRPRRLPAPPTTNRPASVQ